MDVQRIGAGKDLAAEEDGSGFGPDGVADADER